MTNGFDTDILIIGGGINGVGIAWDAAGRDLRVTLCKKDDLADAISSASTKLIHGGLRYLVHHERACTAEDILWRRTKLGLRAASDNVASPERWVDRRAA